MQANFHYKALIDNLKISVAFIILFALAALLISFNNNLKDPELSEIVIEQLDNHTEILIENLLFNSRTSGSDYYNITAKQAIKNKDGNYSLSNVTAKLTLKDAQQIIVLANHGYFVESTQILQLDKNVKGNIGKFELYANDLFMNMADHTVKTRNHVALQSENIKINSDTLDYDGNEQILLQGNVKTIIKLNN